jgi:hypothetical protein
LAQTRLAKPIAGADAAMLAGDFVYTSADTR